jgi:hypothetical protein
VDSGKEKLQFTAHEVKVTSVAFTPDGKALLSGGVGNVVIPNFFINAQHADQACLWDAATGKQIRQLSQRGSQVAVSPDGKTFAAGGLVIVGMPVGKGVSINGGASVHVGPARPGREWLTISNQGGAFAFSADGKYLATTWGSRQHLGRFNVENQVKDRRVILWELATGKEMLFLNEEGAPIVALSPDGRTLAAGRLYGGVFFHDLKPKTWDAGSAANLRPEELERFWGDLAGDNVVVAYHLLWTFGISDKTVPLFKEKLQPVKPAGEQVEKLLANLDSKIFKVRENAFRDLKKMGSAIEPDLRRTLQGKISDEVRQRVEKLLAAVEHHPATPDELRQWRALQILERIGNAEARALLTRLAEGAPGAWLTTEAQGCLERLRRR